MLLLTLNRNKRQSRGEHFTHSTVKNTDQTTQSYTLIDALLVELKMTMVSKFSLLTIGLQRTNTYNKSFRI